MKISLYNYIYSNLEYITMATIFDVPNNSSNAMDIDQLVHKIYNRLANEETMSPENISDLNNKLATVDLLQIDGTDHPVANGNLKLVYDSIFQRLTAGNGPTWNEMRNLTPLKKKKIIKSLICYDIGIPCSQPTVINGGKKKRVRFQSRRKKSSGRKSHRKKESHKKRKTKRSKLKH